MEKSQPDLSTGPIAAHLWRLAWPAAVGMVFNTLYNLTDFWFAGLLSAEALAGVSIAGSVFFLLVSIGAGMQTGTTAMMAADTGAGRMDDVRSWFNNALGLGLLVSGVTLAGGWMLAAPLVRFLGAESHIEPLALQYLQITLIGNASFIAASVATGGLMALGDTRSASTALAVGFFANFGLNPLLTFGLGLGVYGLALATVMIKIATAVYLIAILNRRLGFVSRPVLMPSRIIDLCRQVLPASFNMLTIIIGGFITVSFIGRFGSENVAGYAVGLRLEQLLLLPALGLNTAVMALAGQNYGAGKTDRVRESWRKGLQAGAAMALISMPVMIFLSPLMMAFFSDNRQIQQTGAMYLRIDAAAFYGYVVLFICVATLQALRQPLFPLVIGLIRQLILPAIANYTLIVVLGYPMPSVFYSIVIIVLLSAVFTWWYTCRQLARLK